jgi:FkbM family methyltransferase
MPIFNSPLVRRLIRWPLRYLPQQAVVPIVSGRLRGKRWVIGAGPHGYWAGIYEADKQRHLQRLVRRGDCVFDVGANAGFFTLLASELVGPTGRVVAFEPLPRNIGYLQRHLRMNRAANVRLCTAAVGDAPGTALFTIAGNPSMGSLSATGTLSVPVVALDTFVGDKKLRPPQVIKIDVEGAESAVLRGAAEILTRYRPYILFSGHGTAQQQACAALLADLGYDLVVEQDGSEDGMYESVAFPRPACGRRLTIEGRHDGN